MFAILLDAIKRVGFGTAMSPCGPQETRRHVRDPIAIGEVSGRKASHRSIPRSPASASTKALEIDALAKDASPGGRKRVSGSPCEAAPSPSSVPAHQRRAGRLEGVDVCLQVV